MTEPKSDKARRNAERFAARLAARQATREADRQQRERDAVDEALAAQALRAYQRQARRDAILRGDVLQ